MTFITHATTGSPGLMTYSGRMVFPFQFEPHMARLMDIFVHLAYTNRFNGALGAASPSIMAHSLNAYSFARNMTRTQSRYKTWDAEMVRAFHVLAFIHDWPEYILGDITRPVRRVAVTEDYLRANDEILSVLSEKYFHLDVASFDRMEEDLAIADNGCLFHEICQASYRRAYAGQLDLAPFERGVHDLGWTLAKSENDGLGRASLYAGFLTVLRTLGVSEEIFAAELD